MHQLFFRSSDHSDAQSEIRIFAIISAVASLFLLCALTLVNLDAPYANLIVLALTASMIASVYVVLGLIELELAGKLMSMKSSAILWVSVIAILIWFSRINALADVNGIFGVDASLLPMATAAATFMQVLILLQPAMYLTLAVSVVLCVMTFPTEGTRKEIIWYCACHAFNTLAFILIVSLISKIVSSHAAREQIIYRIAHSADFNSKSPCTNVDAKLHNVLYLDPLREKILIAPRIEEREPTTFLTFSLLAPVPFSRDFKHLECRYKLLSK